MRHFWIASLLVLTWTSSALAEGPEGAPPPGQPPPGQPPPGQQQYEVQPTPTYEEQPQAQGQYQEQPVTGQEGRGIEYGAHIVVPIWVNEDIQPGIGIQGRVGWEFGGGVTAELSVGAMINGYTDEWAERSGEDGFSNVWIGGGGRYMFFNPSAFVPFIGAGLKLNIWNKCIAYDDGAGGTTTECSGDSQLTLGVNGIVGAAYEISPYVAIELGLDVNYTFPGDVFVDHETGESKGELYLSPFVGGTLYF